MFTRVVSIPMDELIWRNWQNSAKIANFAKIVNRAALSPNLPFLSSCAFLDISGLAILFCWLSTLLAKKRWKKVQGVSNSHRMCTHAGRQPQYATIITFESTRLFFCNKVGAASLSYFPQAMIELVLPGALTIASDFEFEISAAVFNQIPSTVASGIPVIWTSPTLTAKAQTGFMWGWCALMSSCVLVLETTSDWL